MTKKLGKLKRVELREIWPKEAKDFTPWLAREENLKLLADAIGMELEFEAQEEDVGPFSADIFCKSTIDGSWVVIENQLGRTDHTHLGQLLTYAAGLGAETIIWIAKEFREEHRAALDLLNDTTDENSHYFGLEIELWRIGDSPPAPKFNIVAKPNYWQKAKQHSGEQAMTGIKKLQDRYWRHLSEHIQSSDSKLHMQRGRLSNFRTFAAGRSDFHIGTVLNIREQRIQVELCIYHPKYTKLFFRILEEDKEAIEREIGFPLEWKELPENKVSKIILSREANPKDESDWPSQHIWLKETVERFDKTFRPRIKKFDPNDYNNEDDEDYVADEGEET